MPLVVQDPTGTWTRGPGTQRRQLVESVDRRCSSSLATGGEAWRRDSRYAQIAGRATSRGKIARYAFWKDGGIEIDRSGRIDREVYDYSTAAGRREVDTLAAARRLPCAERRCIARMEALLERAVDEEIQAPLPQALQPVQQQAFQARSGQYPGTFTRETVH